MKTLKIKLNKSLSILGVCMLTALSSFSKSHVTMIMKNIATTTNTITYDLCLVNDGSTALRLGACSYGIDFSSEILNNGNVSFRLLPGTLNQAFSTWSPFSLNSRKAGEQNQVRMTSVVHKDKTVQLLPHQVVVVGRFEMKNSKQWTANSKTKFSMNELTRVGFTTCQVLTYVDDEQLITVLTPKDETVDCVIEECPILNPSEVLVNNTSAGLATLSSIKEIRCYPNPVLDKVNLSIKASKAGDVLIALTDMTGRTIQSKSATCIEGYNEIDVSCNDLASGTYILSVKEGEQVAYTQRISKK